MTNTGARGREYGIGVMKIATNLGHDKSGEVEGPCPILVGCDQHFANQSEEVEGLC